MVEILRDELLNRLALESTAKINWEVTKKLQQETKYVEFNKWCDDNGVIHPSVMYPVAFGPTGGLVGLSATRRIGFQESYIYVPTKLIICEDQFRNDPKIGHILDKHPEAFLKRQSSEHLVLIFFVMIEMGKGRDSLWYPYFQITEKTDMLSFWKEEDLQLLQDEILKAEALDEIDSLKEEYEILLNIVKLYPESVNEERFTFEIFQEAHTLCVTRCFGFSLPYLMLVPLADCANHHATDNQYELFNSRLSRLGRENAKTEEEHCYFTSDKRRINFFKHFSEEFNDVIDVPYKSARYAKKVNMRNRVLKTTTLDFMTSEDYYEKDIWDLKYISTSDEEDNDSDMASDPDSSEEEESDSDESTKKEVFKEGDKLPQMFKTFNQKTKTGVGAKGPARVQYEYRYSTDPNNQQEKPRKTTVVRKRVDRKGPQNLIDVLIIQKLNMYEREERMRLLKEHDDEDWLKMQAEYNSSEEEVANGEDKTKRPDDTENYCWYRFDDPETYFTLATKHKNIIDKDQQIFHCYGRRTNRYLLANYGFCLEYNKYNSLAFRVWIDFNHAEGGAALPKKEKKQKNPDDSDYDEEESEDSEEKNKISKVIRLKLHKIREDVFAYLRTSLMQKYDASVKEHLLVSTPVDPDFELLVVACAINLFTNLLQARFKTTGDQDKQELNNPNLSMRARFAIMHRYDCKSILENNIKICQILARILARIQFAVEQSAQTGNQLTRQIYKRIYMEQVDQFETKNEVLMNRVRVRKYLRELLLNQKRVMEAITRKGFDTRVSAPQEKPEATSVDQPLPQPATPQQQEQPTLVSEVEEKKE